MQENRVQSVGQENHLEKGMATYTAVFLPGEFHGQRSLTGYSPRGPKESDMTEWLSPTHLLWLNGMFILKMWKLSDFIFLGCKINADGDCSHKIKWCLLLGRIAMTNLDSILKNRDITLPTKVHIVKAVVFPVAVYGCESWTIKKAEHQRIDPFELWCWRRLLRVPWTARSNCQS